jgi:hypothetical protein
MADKKTTEDDGPDETEVRNAAKGLIREALDEWFEENKPAPEKTKQPQSSSIFNALFGG